MKIEKLELIKEIKKSIDIQIALFPKVLPISFKEQVKVFENTSKQMQALIFIQRVDD